MSKPKHKKSRRHEPSVKSGGWRKFFIAITVVLIVGIAAVVTLLRGGGGGFDALNGRWLRPDGGYIFEIRAVDASGKIDAVYLNPKPDQHRQSRSHARWLEIKCLRRAPRTELPRQHVHIDL